MDYQYTPMPPQMQEKKSGAINITSFVMSLISLLCCNPLYMLSIAAIITGIVGIVTGADKKGLGIAGLVIGFIAVAWGVLLDALLFPLTFGMSFFF